jgi:Uma2 family endonuclease
MGDLLHALGDVPPGRVLLHPTPGTATEAELLELLDHENRTCELVDGTLVEKPLGIVESMLAVALVRLLGNYVAERKLGVLSGPDGPYRLRFGLVRFPDIAFIPWDRLPGKPTELPAIPSLIPTLAVEVLSESNTRREMDLKREEYFRAGVQLVWMVDPESRSVEVYRQPRSPEKVLRGADAIEGAEVLPGFTLTVESLFAELDPPRPPSTAGQHE